MTLSSRAKRLSSRAKRLSSRAKRGICFLLVLILPITVQAQGGILLQGVLDVEGWKTDTSSNMLSRNRGEPAGLYRLSLWSAIEPVRGVFLFGNGVAQGGNALRYDGPASTVELEQGGIRWARHRALVIDAGRMIHPIGAFGQRLLSTRNPLIGIPDAYLPVYPLGVMARGEKGKVDYRAGVVSLPPTHRDYVPEPDPAVHPVVGVGVTPITGLRIGFSATSGPYLNEDFAAYDWRSQDQRVIATDLQYGVGHFDFRGEFAITDFEVPTKPRIDGPAGYAEVRATLTPRVFVAARGELNRYPFIRAAPGTQGTNWITRRTELRAIEAGLGFRFDASTLLKLSFSADDWVVTPENSSFVRPGGKAIAVQLSREFDLIELATRRH
jgi:hypothetical protein